METHLRRFIFFRVAEIGRKILVKVGKAFTHASSWDSCNIREHSGHISAQHSYYGTDTALQDHRYSPENQHHHNCILHRGKKNNRYMSEFRIFEENLPLNINQSFTSRQTIILPPEINIPKWKVILQLPPQPLIILVLAVL